MYRKCFLKSKGVLSRRFVASGLAAVFSAGMFGSYAGAMKRIDNDKVLFPMELEVQFLDDIKEDDENTEKVFRFLINSNDLLGVASFFYTWKDEDDNKLSQDLGFVVRAVAYALLSKFYESKDKFSSIDDLLKEAGLSLQLHTVGLSLLKEESKKFLLDKIKGGWGKKILEKLEKEKLEKEKLEKQGNLDIINTNLNNENVDNYESNKNIGNKTKNKFCKNIIFIFVAIILLSVIVAKILAGKSKTNTGVPNNNNKDDEKVNPSIEPEKDKDDEKMNPSTDPESDEQNPEQKKQEQESSVGSVETANLKAVGASVFLGGGLAGVVTHLVNEVLLKRGKSRKVGPKNINGNDVTKTEESEKTHDNYVADNENANNSGTKQLLEDKDTEEKEEGQEEILVGDALSDDTESNSDEDKNKD